MILYNVLNLESLVRTNNSSNHLYIHPKVYRCGLQVLDSVHNQLQVVNYWFWIFQIILKIVTIVICVMSTVTFLSNSKEFHHSAISEYHIDLT